jgi:xanthine dehydrogenase accessory factor
MNSADIELIRTALAWLDGGQRVVMGTVVRTWGSAPRPPGSLMVIRDDGQVAGSVSGGCIEDDLIARVTRGELAPLKPVLAVYGQNADEVHRFGLPCGGTVQVVLEPLGAQSCLRELLVALEGQRRVRRDLDMGTGRAQLDNAIEGEQMSFDGHTLRTVHGPRLRLLIIGGGALSQFVARMALLLDYQITVCEPREAYHEGWHDQTGVMLSTQMPDDLVLAMHLDANSALVALTHDPKLDDLALMEALRTPAFYVGALGSQRSNQRRCARLLGFDVTPAQAARLHGPVGLRLGALTPAEIALSILADMTAVRRGVDLSQPLTWPNNSTTESSTQGVLPDPANTPCHVEFSCKERVGQASAAEGAKKLKPAS